MAESQTVAEAVATARQRIRQACQACRKRRRKCNGELPCSQCTFYQYDCVYGRPEPDPSTHQTHRHGRDTNRHSQTRSRAQPAAENAERSELQSGVKSGTNNNAAQAGRHSRGLAEGHADASQDPPTRFFDERKGRYCGRHSSVAFPHLVRTAVGSSAPLRLHAYGWNVNLRPETQPPGWSSIRRVITYQEIEKYSSIFLDAIGPVYELFDPPTYHERSRIYWTARTDPSPDFEALVAGVVALGSLFSQEGSMAELQLVEHAKTILDIGCSYAPGRLSTDQGAAWVLRTIYLRCTTRPHIAWFASCASMHVAEGLGLHLNQATGTNDADKARLRILHCALLLNGLISAEYGRSRVRIDMPSGTIPDTVPTSENLALAQALFALEEPLVGAERLQSLKHIAQLHTGHSVLQLHKVDIAIHWYRRNVYGVGCASLTHAEHELLVNLLRDGFTRIPGLLASAYPWWNVLSTPFQSLLALLSIDSDESLALVPEAINCLNSTANMFGVSLAAETVETARYMVKALKEKKMAHAHHLRDGDRVSNANGAGDMNAMIPPSGDILLGSTMDNWLEMFDLDGATSIGWGTSGEMS